MPDEPLHSAFEALRAADRERTPSFASVWRNAQQTRHRFRLSAALAVCMLALLIFGTSIVMMRRAQTVVVTTMPLPWQGPTDFLLETPGSDLASEVPHFSTPVPHYTWKGNVR